MSTNPTGTQCATTTQVPVSDRRLSEACADILAAWQSADEPGERSRQRARVVATMLPLARQIARRYGHRGEPVEDLEQIAVVGLLGALDRLDPTRTKEFVAFAKTTMVGEVKRHFRDHGWAVRPPRRLQELGAQVREASQRLPNQLGRSPTVDDLAADLDVSPEEIVEAISAYAGYATDSLDAPVAAGEDSGQLGDVLGQCDERLSRIEDWQALAPVIKELPEHVRRILSLRFAAEWTQSQIAAEIGCSQMQISRILSHTLRRLRLALV